METERNISTKVTELKDESTSLRSKLANATSENESLRSAVEGLRAELRRKEELIIRTETALTSAERDHLRTQDDLRASMGRLTMTQSAETELRDAIQQKNNHIDGLRHTIAVLQEQLAAKETANARIFIELAAKKDEAATIAQKAERTERHLEEKLTHYKDRQRLLASDLKHMHQYVGKREVEVLDLAEKLEDREATLAEMSPILAASRRTNKLLQLRQEREEAERLEALARYRARHSFK